jgi:hypothetical protein
VLCRSFNRDACIASIFLGPFTGVAADGVDRTDHSFHGYGNDAAMSGNDNPTTVVAVIGHLTAKSDPMGATGLWSSA